MEYNTQTCSLRNFFLNDLEKPVLLKKYLLKSLAKEKWKCLEWGPGDWQNLLQNHHYPVQFGKKISGNSYQAQDLPQWEYLNLKGVMMYEEILQWHQGQAFQTLCKTKVSPKEYWVYLDYYYMKNLSNIKLANEILSWEALGFPEIKAQDSTIWIGTEGANTPCHLDTYGSNIVCQVYGKKRWTLFPKDQSPYLYPTRIPYEESSIYSEVGFPRPNLEKFDKLRMTSPFLVTLEAGDVLLVPKHWWHFVESLDFSISINTWLPFSTDANDRLKEALVLFQVGSLCHSLTSTSLLRSIFHSNMMDTVLMDSTELFQFLQSKILLYQSENDEKQNLCHLQSPSENKNIENILKSLKTSMQEVPMYSFEQYCTLVGINYSKNEEVDLHSSSSLMNSDNSESTYVKLLLKSFTDERVIQTLKNVLDENLNKV